MSTVATTSQRLRLQPLRTCSSRNVAMRHSFPPHLKAVFRHGTPHPPGARPNLAPRLSVILPKVKRLADPYRDLDVIDSRAPRFNQATIAVLAPLAVATGWWWLLGILAAQLAVGLTLGRRFCLPCLAYFELVQRRFDEGPLEDSRPP